MIALLLLLPAILASPFKLKCQLEAENVALEHQVVALRRQVRGRVRLSNFDRLVLIQLFRWFPSILKVLAIVQPETVIRWHRAGIELRRPMVRRLLQRTLVAGQYFANVTHQPNANKRDQLFEFIRIYRISVIPRLAHNGRCTGTNKQNRLLHFARNQLILNSAF